MRNLVLSVILPFFFGAISYGQGSGGMIGGGEVNFRTLLECDAESLDPTFPSAPYVWVVKDVDYYGQFIPDATLRVVTLDYSFNPVSYHISHLTDLVVSPGNILELQLWRFDVGSSGNYLVGAFYWNSEYQQGVLSTNYDGVLEELLLSNCTLDHIL